MAAPLQQVEVVRVRSRKESAGVDVAATEEPMQVRVNGEPFAVIMRTPGSDRELAAGFLLSERVVIGPEDLGTIEYCPNPENPELQNVLTVGIVGEQAVRLGALMDERRRVVMNSSCGLCGRVTIESLRAEAPPVIATWTIDADLVARLPVRLREAQTVFEQTGGLHAAGLFDRQGGLERLAEDVGRHNAVDKVIGRMLLLERLPLDESILFVSGRLSFEIVQKAFLAGVPIVGAVSAPSTLAIELAEEAGITLLGFVRGDSFNIYTHRERIRCEA